MIEKLTQPEEEQAEARFEAWFEHEEQMRLEPELSEPEDE